MATGRGGAVDREVERFTELFRVLAVAGRAVAGYPPGHPSARRGLATAHAVLSAVLQEIGPLELGAARDALLWNEHRFSSPAATTLARQLRRRRAAALHADPGVTEGELETLLRALAVDARTAGEAGTLSAELAAAGLVHLRVSDLDFSSLALVEGEEEASAPEAGPLAERVVRRLLASGAVPAAAHAEWIGSGRAEADLLRVLFETAGAGGELGAWGPAAFAAAVEFAAEERKALAAAPAPGPGGSTAPDPATTGLRGAQVATLRQAFATDDVDAFRDGCTPSDTLSALLELPEEGAPQPLPPAADVARAELGEPALARDPAVALAELAERPEVPPDALPAILARLAAALRGVLAAGRVRPATVLLDRILRRGAIAGPGGEPFRACARALAGSETIDALVAPLADLPEEAVDHAATFVQRLGPPAIRPVLEVLARTENRRMRFRLLDLLSRLGPAVARDAESMLGDERWYVVRNMLLLLRRVGDARSVPAVRRCVEHPDLRVRLEAIHNLFAFDRVAPGQHLRRALNDPDPRQAEAAMELAGKYGIAEAVPAIVEYLSAWDPLGRKRAIRLKAIRALAAIGDPAALRGLSRFHGRMGPFLPSIEERRELYRTLPAYPEAAYQDWIVAGLRSRDPEIRRLSAAMGPAPGGAP
jgi:HEAT repeat protein